MLRCRRSVFSSFASLIAALAVPLSLAMQAPIAFAQAAPVGTPLAPGHGAGTIPGIKAQIIINAPGHYYLTQNLTVPAENHGIYINAGRVTLDLSGLAINGQSGSLFGVYVAPFQDKPRPSVTIENGTISGMGYAGIFAYNVAAGTIRDIQVAGCNTDGIRLGQGLIENCHARGVNGVGISTYGGSIIRDCTATKCVNGFSSSYLNIILPANIPIPAPVVTGQNTIYEACNATDNTYNGFLLGSSSSATNCSAFGHKLTGFALTFGSSATNCTAGSNSTGYSLADGCSLRDSTSTNSSVGASIAGRGAVVESNTIEHTSVGIDLLPIISFPPSVNSHRGSRIESNTITFPIPGQFAPNTVGIRVNAEQNLIIGNLVLGATTPYQINTGNSIGPVLQLGTSITAATSPLCNFSN